VDRPLRVLHVIPSYPPAVRYGGAVLATHGLCRALAAAGHHVEVFTSDRDGDDRVPGPLDSAAELEGVRVHRHSLDGPRRLYYSTSLARRLRARAHDFDVIHGHSLFLQPVDAASRAAHAAGVPFVLSPRGMLVRELFRARSALPKWAWLLATGRRQIRQAAALHLTSEVEANEARRFPVTLPPCLVIANGIDAPPPPALAREPDRLLFLGRLSWKKRVDTLIHTLARLPRCHLRIVGSDDEGLQSGLMALAQQLGVARRVHFIGGVSLQQRWDEYARAGVFLLPSLSENFANTVLEAMAMACPVVITPEVGLSDTVQRYGAGRVSRADPDRLAEAVREVLADRYGADSMGRNGRDAVLREFLWPGIAARMAQAYADLRAPRRATMARGARR
jgi:glycosyltransferase involved in cell wall biosynthesis